MNFMECPIEIGLERETGFEPVTSEAAALGTLPTELFPLVLARQFPELHRATPGFYPSRSTHELLLSGLQRSLHEVHNVFPADCLHHFKIVTALRRVLEDTGRCSSI